MKRITRELKIIRSRKILDKARVEYHSFMGVRELKDIYSSVNLLTVMLRLEGNLVTASNSLEKLIERK